MGALRRQSPRHGQGLGFVVGAMGRRDDVAAGRRRRIPPNRKCKDAKHNNLRRSKHTHPPSEEESGPAIGLLLAVRCGAGNQTCRAKTVANRPRCTEAAVWCGLRQALALFPASPMYSLKAMSKIREI